ncbi:hypothetical protein [Piscinibacter sakaiensis]|uniref:hypothetical protein n=1 Tax=Piscinibacter sakaiensis TaxID=1547922 RepID=UPI003AAC3DB7
MLSITATQMRQLGTSSRDRFIRSMAAHLRDKFGERASSVPDERLHEQIGLAIKHAKTFGIEYEDDLRRYLEYMAIYGAPLEQSQKAPWIGKILQDEALTGTRKMDLIGDYELHLLRSGR